MFCIQVPMFEIIPAPQNAVNSRDRNATSGPGSLAPRSMLAISASTSSATSGIYRRRPILVPDEHMFVYAARVVADQRSLFATGVAVCDEGAPIERCDLADGAWIDLRRGWVRGSDAVLDHLIESVEWRRGRRRMFDRVLDDPCLSCWYQSGDALPTRCWSRWARRCRASTAWRFRPLVSTTTAMGVTASRSMPTASCGSSTTPWSRSSPSVPADPSWCAGRAAGARSISRRRAGTCW